MKSTDKSIPQRKYMVLVAVEDKEALLCQDYDLTHDEAVTMAADLWLQNDNHTISIEQVIVCEHGYFARL